MLVFFSNGYNHKVIEVIDSFDFFLFRVFLRYKFRFVSFFFKSIILTLSRYLGIFSTQFVIFE